MARAVFITTPDNPYDPYEDYDNWYAYDCIYHGNTSAYLARISRESDQLSDEENMSLREAAIDEIIAMNGTSAYIKIVKEVNKEPVANPTDM